MRRIRPITARWPAAAVVLWAAAAGAAEIDVSPMRVELSAQRHRDVITFVNNDTAPATFQVEGFLWTQEDGGDLLAPADDLLAVPPVFTVAPASSQAVRIGFRQMPHADREVSFRLIFTEIPDTTKGGATLSVTVVLRISLPVFFTPQGAAAVPQWSARRADPKALELVLGNAGNAHIRVTDLAVFSAARPDQRVAATDAPRYVLPGATTTWVLPLERPLMDSSVIVKSTTTRGELRETVAVSAR